MNFLGKLRPENGRKNRYWIVLGVLALAALGVLAAPYTAVWAASPAAVFVVSVSQDTADANPGDGSCDIGNGQCTLRAAIQEANALPGKDTIEFGAMPIGTAVIGLSSPLPIITDSIQIIGQTHPSGMIELNGGGVSGSGFHVTAGDSEISGFRIYNFVSHGIHLSDNGNNNIHDNIIGLPIELNGVGNGGDGILVDNIPSNTINNNVISNNGLNGIELFGAGATNNVITGNRIGTNVFGDTAFGNVRNGILLNNAPQNTIGGTFADGNLIAGNRLNGIEIGGLQANNNLITGNRIGLDSGGSGALPNGKHGIFINDASVNTIGGTSANLRNVISGNVQDGVLIHGGAGGNQLLGNYVGTSTDGLSALGNGESGVHINRSVNNMVGGTSGGAGNLLAGNGEYGAEITSDIDIGPGPLAEQNVVLGNLIGTNLSGLVSLGNGFGGVLIHEARNNTIGGSVSGSRNIIAGNAGNGVEISDPLSSSNDVFGNFIGTNISGTAALPNSGSGVMISEASLNHIGSDINGGSGNLISGNGANGVHIFGGSAAFNSIETNSIGLHVASGVLPNQQNGVFIDRAHSTTIGGVGLLEGNFIAGNGQNGILISGTLAYDNHILGNLIGYDGYSNATTPNAENGVAIYNAGNNWIGSAETGSGNLISDNGQNGILISGSSASFNVVLRNQIGSNAAGNNAKANAANGISIQNAPRNEIGGSIFAEGNLISGNLGHGILLSGTGSFSNTINNNLIGVDPLGASRLPNEMAGIRFNNALSNTIGGVGLGNLISGNNGPGVVISGSQSSGNRIWSNRIGTNFLGTAEISNFPDGIQVNAGAMNTFIGGTMAGQGNLISGNITNGIAVGCQPAAAPDPDSTIIAGNLIGVNITGTAEISNYVGIRHCFGRNTVIGGATTGARNLISGNETYGIYSQNGNSSYFPLTIQGNFIGVDMAGTAAIPNGSDGISIYNPLSLIGGSAPGAGNLISGNGRYGVNAHTVFLTLTIQIQGNLIGTDVSGNADLGNQEDGIAIGRNVAVGGYNPSERNIISGNGGCGIQNNEAGASQSIVVGNYIGVNISGTQNLGNSSHGICFTFNSQGIVIGGAAPGAGNLIAFNGGAGIYFAPLSSHLQPSPIRRNSIYGNAGLAIDLTPNDGPTPNDLLDPDFGPNQFQNYPVLVGVRNYSATTIISGTLNSQPTTSYTIEFFASGSCDSSGYGEGERFLGDTAVFTNFDGDATFRVTLPVTLPSGQFVTMTATDNLGNTSEFSQCSAEPTAISVISFIARSASGFWPGWPLMVLVALTFMTLLPASPKRRGWRLGRQ